MAAVPETGTRSLLRRDAQGRIPELDGLRGVAIALVLLFHGVAALLPVSPGTPLGYLKWSLALTWSGVDLFFVLSGFLIGGILLDQRRSPSYFATFYTRRVCRIFPLYYTVLAIYLAIRYLVPHVASAFGYLFYSGAQVPSASYLLYVQNVFMATRAGGGPPFLSPTWSLAVEEQFYVLLPALVYLLRPRRLVTLLLALILLTPLVRWALWTRLGYMSCMVLLPARWDALFLGVLSAWVVRQPAWERRLLAHRRAALAALLALLLAVAAMTRWTPGVAFRFMGIAGYGVLALTYTALLLVVLLQRGGRLGRVMRAAPLKKLGEVSYGVYLIHMPILGFVFVFLRSHVYGKYTTPRIHSADDALAVGLALGLSLVLALASHRWFERPLIALGHRKRYAPEPPAG